MIPRYDRPPVAGQRYRRRPGAYALLLRGGQVLLTHQAAPVPEFQLPGGGIDPGEHPLAALHREVFEETGWTMGAARRIGQYRRFVFMPEYDMFAEKVCSVWLARPGVRRAAPTEAGHSAHWLPLPQAVAALGDPGARAVLRRFLR
ncbi:MAG: NUDIX hydrolase [Paracoccus sp. (in: a-proteobacteria)]|uniref:NUDIX hydrolase n=1 Tax=Paracoccus sp. TaxID=267 RepID=UPI0026DF8C6D|nr:NUDIX hydrolase [Paracoccus sp. (in: a-proteobacteria)]MDO5611713.1 NUDIX hydrolase [Paracoccus sp. (in: a-proteobacteria)]